MMNKTVWLAAIAGVVAIACMSGGPSPVRAERLSDLWGAQLPPCTNPGTARTACPDAPGRRCMHQSTVCINPGGGFRNKVLCVDGQGNEACKVVDPKNCNAQRNALVSTNCTPNP
jgi:hypothetical protein